jgi:hypothetical protein
MRGLQAVTGPAKASERRMNLCTITYRKVTTVACFYIYKKVHFADLSVWL